MNILVDLPKTKISLASGQELCKGSDTLLCKAHVSQSHSVISTMITKDKSTQSYRYVCIFRSRSRSPSLSSDPSVRKADRERIKRAERLRENNAARKIQRGWRSHRHQNDQDEV